MTTLDIFYCNRRTPHRAHTFTVGPDYGPTYAGTVTECPGLTIDDFDTHQCNDPGCPCGDPKPGVSGETAADHQPRVHAHDVDPEAEAVGSQEGWR